MKQIENIQTQYVVAYDFFGYSNESFDTLAEAKKRQKERAAGKSPDASVIYKQTIISQLVEGSRILPNIRFTDTVP